VMKGPRLFPVEVIVSSGRDGPTSTRPSRCAALRCEARPPVTSVAACNWTPSDKGARNEVHASVQSNQSCVPNAALDCTVSESHRQ
jgi:hypothetical protein